MQEQSWEFRFMKDVKVSLQGNLQVNIKQLLEARLEQWIDVEVKFGITGNSGVGKSSFINAIRK